MQLAQHRVKRGDKADNRPGLGKAHEVIAAQQRPRADHEWIGEQIGRLRTLSDEYTAPEWACRSYRTLFAELEALETDVLRHVHLENHVLFPRFTS